MAVLAKYLLGGRRFWASQGLFLASQQASFGVASRGQTAVSYVAPLVLVPWAVCGGTFWRVWRGEGGYTLRSRSSIVSLDTR